VDRNGLLIERRTSPRGTWLGLEGELDVTAVGSAETWLTSEVLAADGDVDMDLSGLDFMGFAGVRLLDVLARRLAVSGRRLRITASNPLVDRILEIAGANDGRASADEGPDHRRAGSAAGCWTPGERQRGTARPPRATRPVDAATDLMER